MRAAAPTPSPMTGEARRGRAAITVVFVLNGLIFGSWVARIPQVKEQVAAGPGALGLALFGAIAGSMLSMPFVGALARRFGSQRVVVVAAIASAAVMPAVGAPSSALELGLVLIAFGAGMGAFDVAMNVNGMVVVRAAGRPLMPSFHAGFSVGGILGAVTGGLAAAAGVPVAAHLSVTAAVVVAVIVVVAVRGLLLAEPPRPRPTGTEEPAAAPSPRRRLPRPGAGLVVLAAVAFCAAYAEGAIADWSGIYLDTSVGTGPGLAAAGFAAFSGAMTVGRLGGERLLLAIGPARVLQVGGLLAAVGLAQALAFGGVGSALVGFALVGLGLSSCFPIAMAGAGGDDDESAAGSGPRIAFVTTVGYVGFLIGPPLIGAIAELIGLPSALVSVVALTAAVSALGFAAPRLRAARERAAERRPVSRAPA